MARNPALVKMAATMKPEAAHSNANPKVFFDVTIGGIKAGRITFEVYDRVITRARLRSS